MFGFLLISEEIIILGFERTIMLKLKSIKIRRDYSQRLFSDSFIGLTYYQNSKPGENGVVLE